MALKSPSLSFRQPRQLALGLRCASSRSLASSARQRDNLGEVKVTDRMSLKDRTILVTGGGRGIGFAVTKAIAQMGGNVAVVDALSEPVDEFHSLEDKYGAKAFYYQGDVTKQDSFEHAFNSAAKHVGDITGCVAAAGIAIDKPFLDHQWEESKRVLEVNTLGCFWAAKLTAQHIANHGKGGSIVMIASIAAQGIKIPQQNVSIYNMSKAAVKGLVGPLAVEMAPYKIRVNTVSPGVILSPMTNALKTQYPELLQMFENASPAQRIGVPEDLTPAVVYLLSDAASFTTGTDIIVSGGFHAGTSMNWKQN